MREMLRVSEILTLHAGQTDMVWTVRWRQQSQLPVCPLSGYVDQAT
jgi:hypothetical protein